MNAQATDDEVMLARTTMTLAGVRVFAYWHRLLCYGLAMPDGRVLAEDPIAVTSVSITPLRASAVSPGCLPAGPDVYREVVWDDVPILAVMRFYNELRARSWI